MIEFNERSKWPEGVEPGGLERMEREVKEFHQTASKLERYFDGMEGYIPLRIEDFKKAPLVEIYDFDPVNAFNRTFNVVNDEGGGGDVIKAAEMMVESIQAWIEETKDKVKE